MKSRARHRDSSRRESPTEPAARKDAARVLYQCRANVISRPAGRPADRAAPRPKSILRNPARSVRHIFTLTRRSCEADHASLLTERGLDFRLGGSVGTAPAHTSYVISTTRLTRIRGEVGARLASTVREKETQIQNVVTRRMFRRGCRVRRFWISLNRAESKTRAQKTAGNHT